MRLNKFLPIIFLGIAVFGLLDIVFAFVILKLVNSPRPSDLSERRGFCC